MGGAPERDGSSGATELGDLGRLERELRDAIDAGTEAGPSGTDPGEDAAWGPERTVRASVLREFALAAGRKKRGHHSPIRLRGAFVSGALDLSECEIECPIALERCRFEQPPDFSNARLASLWLRGCHLPGLYGRQLRTAGDLVLDDGFEASGIVTLNGARIGGELNLSQAKLSNRGGPALTAELMAVEQSLLGNGMRVAHGEVWLPGSRVGGQVTFAGAGLSNPDGYTIHAEALEVGHDMFCAQDEQNQTRFTSKGEVKLSGAKINGQLVFRGARLSNRGGPALTAESVTVAGGLFCDGDFSAEGKVNLDGAELSSLSFSGASLAGHGGVALDADRTTVRGEATFGTWQLPKGEERAFTARGEVRMMDAKLGSVYLLSARLDGTTTTEPHDKECVAVRADRIEVRGDLFYTNSDVKGAIRIPGARVGGLVRLRKTTLTNDSGPALYAEAITVAEDIQADEDFTATGEVRITNAKVGGLDLTGARLSNSGMADAPALTLDHLDASRLNLRWASQPSGAVSVRNARVAHLEDDPTSWPPDSDLRGLVYRSLDGETNDPNDRLKWIAAAKGGYQPRLYEELQAFYRRAGRERAARDVAIDKQRARRAGLGWSGRVASRLFDWTVGYGYRTARAVWLLLALIAVGWPIFAWASWDHLSAAKSPSQLPEYSPILYSVDSVLPVISLGQEAGWSATGVVLYWHAFCVLSGWLLATAIVAALTTRLTRQ